MPEKTIRPRSVSRRTLLGGTAGLLGGAALSSGPTLAINWVMVLAALHRPRCTAATSRMNLRAM
jgi:hypothetical protein